MSSDPDDSSSSGETTYEQYFDLLIGAAFLSIAIVAAKRTSSRPNGGGAETTVVTAFYMLILVTSVLRALWFLVPATVWQPSYTPVAVFAWQQPQSEETTSSSNNNHRLFPVWLTVACSELVVTAGSLTLFAIFILILVYWADILKKYFHPGSRRSLPMVTFVGLVACLAVLEVVNVGLFLTQFYTTEGMVLYNAVLLALVSIVCVLEITIFSHRFRTVLTTLGAINQVSTDTQVRRIVWITVTGNVFFLTRALLEGVFAGKLLYFWHIHGTVQLHISHLEWDIYTAIKYWSEWIILVLMLYILQSRFTSNAAAPNGGGGGSYQRVPAAEAPNV